MDAAGAPVRLEAAGGLLLAEDGEGALRVGLGADAPDWLGPLALRVAGGEGPPRAPALAARTPFEGRDERGAYHGLALEPREPDGLRASVRAYAEAPLLVFRLEARAALESLGTGRFEAPSVAFPAFAPAERTPGGIPEGTRSAGHQYTEFALPVQGDERCTGFVFAGHRPPVVMPLLLCAPDGRTLLLAPLDRFHEQAIGVPPDAERAAEGVRCGWQGDLDAVPAGFATELALLAAGGPRAALEAWGERLRSLAGTRRPGRYGDELVGKLSYWTDNGSVYYYRTAPGRDYAGTLERAVADLHRRDVPVRAVQLDSWFYPHRNPRPVSDEGAPVVPPSGALRWEPREDVFPEGLAGLRERLGGAPLCLHARHFSSESPYFDEHEAWSDGAYAHPSGPELFELLMEQAAGWGAVTYEQDWMVESFLGVRGLRAGPGRARAWQEALDRAAAERGMTLQWCMATPADFMETVRLSRVASIRTSGDYQYLYDNSFNWTWFLLTNALARALELLPYKDVFLTHEKTPEGFGEPLAEAESLLATLSAGPVGIGDQIGHARPERVRRSCREDGVLVKPDVPLAALDRCFREHPFFTRAPLVGESWSEHPAGRWVYVLLLNASHASKKAGEPLAVRIPLAELGAARPEGPVVAYDPPRDTFARLGPEEALEATLGYQEHAYFVLCPLLPGGVAVFGDVSKWACAGDRRVARITATDDGVAMRVLGAPHTTVEVQGFAAERPRGAERLAPGERRALAPADGLPPDGEGLAWSEADGRFRARVALGERGHAGLRLRVR